MMENLEKRKLIYNNGVKKYQAIVAGYEFGVGITIQSVKGKYLFCIRHPSIKVESELLMEPQEYKQAFDFMTKCILNGHYEAGNLARELYDKYCGSETPSIQTCAFSQ